MLAQDQPCFTMACTGHADIKPCRARRRPGSIMFASEEYGAMSPQIPMRPAVSFDHGLLQQPPSAGARGSMRSSMDASRMSYMSAASSLQPISDGLAKAFEASQPSPVKRSTTPSFSAVRFRESVSRRSWTSVSLDDAAAVPEEAPNVYVAPVHTVGMAPVLYLPVLCLAPCRLICALSGRSVLR